MSIEKIFDQHASRYDQSRRKLVPCFDDFYRIALATIPFPNEQNIDILDLGAGTGLLTEMLAMRFPNAAIDLIDLAGKMLAEAQTRLAPYPNRFAFLTADYGSAEPFGREYDVIISSLSIHHLSDPEKQQLFKKVHRHLRNGGIFVNADQVLGETPKIAKQYQQKWLEQVGEAGIGKEELQAALERMEEDKMATLMMQLRWLRNTGFEDVNCWYKNYSFCVYSGTKGRG